MHLVKRGDSAMGHKLLVQTVSSLVNLTRANLSSYLEACHSTYQVASGFDAA